MKSLFVFLLLGLTQLSFAYTAKDIKLTDNEFKRIVKPQLNSIYQDYQTLIGLLNPHLSETKKIFRSMNTIILKENRLKQNCAQIGNQSCIKDLDIILGEINKSILELQKINPPKDMKNYTHEQIVSSLHRFQSLQEQLLELHLKLFNYNFFHKSKIASNFNIDSILMEVHKTNNLFNIFLIEYSDHRFKTQFFSYWNSFIKHVTKIIHVNHSKTYFLNNLNDLNLRWNVLNIELTKRNKKISKQVKTLLKIMHNRWNNILKTTLR